MIDAIISAARVLCAELENDILTDAPERQASVRNALEARRSLLARIEMYERDEKRVPPPNSIECPCPHCRGLVIRCEYCEHCAPGKP